MSFPMMWAVLAFGAGDVTEEIHPRQVCGRNALAVVAAYHHEGSAAAVERLLPDDRAPYSFADLAAAAQSQGLKTRSMRWRRIAEATFPSPAILHVKSEPGIDAADHYIACFGRDGDGFFVADYPNRVGWMRTEHLDRIWDGTALYVGTEEPFPQSAWARWRVPQSLPVWLALAAVAGVGWWVTRRAKAGSRLATANGLCVFAVAAGLGLAVAAAVDRQRVPFGSDAADRHEGVTASGLSLSPRRLDLVAEADESQRQVRVEVVNGSGSAVAVEEVIADCRCMTVDQASLEAIAPGGHGGFAVTLTFPEAGRVDREVLVRFDNGEHLRLPVRATAGAELPFVKRVGNGSPVFPGHPALARQTVTVAMIESADRPPAVAELVADAEGIAAELTSVRVLRSGDGAIAERLYTFVLDAGASTAPWETRFGLSLRLLDGDTVLIGEGTVRRGATTVAANVR